LGRGGSDYTASIIGSAVDAELIEIWTDVNGIMTADPRIVKGARSIDTVSYEEASELAFLGAKVLHPNTIIPAISKNIPVKILNTFNPSHTGTTVLRNSNNKKVVSIACKKGIEIVDIHTPSMFMMHGFLKKVFTVFDSLGISIDLVSTSEADLSVTLDVSHDVERLAKELRKFAEVDIKKGRAKISIVGSGMAYRRSLLGKIFSSLNGIDIEMISSSASEINQSIVVREENADIAVRKLHKTFFGA
jgi:aspartate kinase